METNLGAGGLPKVVLNAADGARAELYLYGGQVTSWRPAGGVERLFLSERAEFRPGAAIRGGVPVCFPQFAGAGPLPKHGFTRTSLWSLLRLDQAGDPAQAVLQLEDSAATRAIWPHPFRATLTVRLGGARLRLELDVQNTGAAPCSFTGALHTYLRVDDVSRTAVEHLQGLRYRDSASGAQDVLESEPEVRFNGEVDRLYYNAPAQVIVREPQRVMLVRSAGFPDVVVWNPGPVKGAALADMQPDGYRQMVCVEAAVVSTPAELLPGGTWSGMQELMAA